MSAQDRIRSRDRTGPAVGAGPRAKQADGPLHLAKSCFVSTSTRPQARPYVPRGFAIAFATAVACGLLGAFTGPQVVRALGNLVNHQELVLRVLGWCWGGLPFVVLTIAIAQRRRLSQRARTVLTYLLAVWGGSAAFLLPSRTSNLQRRFGDAYPDARPLGFGWGAGVLPLFVMLLLAFLVVVVLRNRRPTRVLIVLWIIATSAGLLVALLAPLPEGHEAVGRRWQTAGMRFDRAILFKLATNERLEQVVKALPGGEENAWRAASRYVAGRTRDEALKVADEQLALGHSISVDLFGELSTDPADADRVVDEYLELAKLLPTEAWLSLDLSHLAVDVDQKGAADRVARIAEALAPGRRLQIGAEDLERTDKIQQCVLDVAARGLQDRIGATVQANLLRSPEDVDALVAAGVQVRLVKGAYVEPTGAHPYGEPTDIAYLQLAHRLAAADANWSMATHDGRLREAILLNGAVPVEQLLGIRPEVLTQLRDRDIPTRVYIPYGPSWFRYWLRRVAESRGA